MLNGYQISISAVNPFSGMENHHTFTLCMDLGNFLKDLLGMYFESCTS